MKLARLLLRVGCMTPEAFKATIHIDGFRKNNYASNGNLQTYSKGLIFAYETIVLWWEVVMDI